MAWKTNILHVILRFLRGAEFPSFLHYHFVSPAYLSPQSLSKAFSERCINLKA